MYIGVDIGGTKTLIATLNNHGEILDQVKFPTPPSYEDFLNELSKAYLELTKHGDAKFEGAGVGVPGRVNREAGSFSSLGHLPWHDRNIRDDVQLIVGCPVVIENDAKLAGLSESMLRKDKSKVLYVTVSTGIGTAVIHDQVLDPAVINSEGGHILVMHQHELWQWEDFASGHAIFDHFGKPASDIDPADHKAWTWIARNLSVGLYNNIAVTQPDLVIIGGSIGTYFDRYGDLLRAELKHLEHPLVPIPEIVGAQRAEAAVVYGCYDLAKHVFGKSSHKH